MYRIIVLLVDLAVLCFVIIQTILSRSFFFSPIFIIVCALLILNIIYIILSKTEKESWLNLYLQRKTLEEKKKIKELQSEKHL